MALSTAICNSIILLFSLLGIVYFVVMAFLNVNYIIFSDDRKYYFL